MAIILYGRGGRHGRENRSAKGFFADLYGVGKSVVFIGHCGVVLFRLWRGLSSSMGIEAVGFLAVCRLSGFFDQRSGGLLCPEFSSDCLGETLSKRKNTGAVGSGIFLFLLVLKLFLGIHEGVDFKWQEFDSVTGINIKLYA